jgi:N-methylhydantoinase A/oxoprolinase/acetone carboxylase beta subunit
LQPEKRYRAGIDIGGTFTDLVLIEDETGRLAVGKVLSTPADPSEAVEEGLIELLGQEGIEAGRLGTVIHGTTLVTNALIERQGAVTALLTT